MLDLDFPGQLAQFTLQGQRAATGLLSTADGMPVITDAVRQQEECIRMFYRQVLGGGAIARDVAAGESRQKMRGSGRETVGEAQMVAQPAYHAVGATEFIGLA